MKKACSFLALYICPVFAALLLACPAPLPAQQNDPAPSYTLQLKTVPDKAAADAELQKIRKLGYDAYISKYTTQTGKVIYKLRSGKFKTRSAAVAAADEYAEKEGCSVMIVAETGRAAAASRSAAEPAAAEESAADKGTTVRVTVKDADKAASPNSLQEKVSALRRGEMPAAKKIQPRQKPEDEIWYTLQASTEFDKRSAERRINKLRDKGYDAYCTEVVQNGRRLFKIRFGRYATSGEAKRAGDQYNFRERRNYLVVKIAAGMDVYPSSGNDGSAKKQEQAPAADTPEPKQPDAAEKPVALAAAARKQAAQEPEEPEAAPEEPKAVPEERRQEDAQPSAAAPPAQEEQLTAAEMPSEPEPPLPEKAPPRGERETALPDDTDAAQAQLPGEEAPAADAPERMTKIYAYRQQSGALNLTNRYEDVPAALRKNIDYISRFPVRIREIAKSNSRLTLEDQEERTEIILAGVKFSDKSESARAYLAALGSKPLRLKYNPWLSAKDGTVAGRLYFKEGSYINLDMVRKGLGQYDAATLAPDQQDAFRQAQEAAKREGAGIWQ